MRNQHTIIAALTMRDGARCYLCGQGADPADPFEIEHRKPVAAGGSDDLDNLELAHRSCNRTKGTLSVTSGGAA